MKEAVSFCGPEANVASPITRLPSNTIKSLPIRPSWAAIGHTQPSLSPSLLGTLATSRLDSASARASLVPMSGWASCLKKTQFRCLKPTCLNAAGKQHKWMIESLFCQRGVVLRLVPLAALSWVRWRREGEPDLVLVFSENQILFLSWTPVSILIPCGSNGGGGDSQPCLPVLL